MTINDIERMAAGPERIAAYRQYVEEYPNHPVAWFNLAIELESDAAYGEARKAIGLVKDLSPELYRRLPARLHELVADSIAPSNAEREIGGYRTTALISASESQLLYAGVRTSDEAPVTIRRLLDISHPGARARFEAELAAPRVDGVVAARELFADPAGTPHLALERIDGETLRDATRSDALDLDVAVRLVRSAARCLAAAHARGVVHGDLRPDHVMRDANAAAASDVRLLGIHDKNTRLPTPYGHLAWQAPEEAAGEPPDERSDVYGIGLLLWHLASGNEPPRLDERTPPPPLGTDWPGLDALIARATARAPAGRLALDAFAAALDELLARRDLPPVVGKWRLGELIGEGTFGRVFAAENVDIAGLRAAVKVLDPYLDRQVEARRQFLKEASAASRIDHPNIVRVLDGGIVDEIAYIAMELLRDGSDLAALIAKGPLEPLRMARLGRQAASALAAAHAASILHRDIKPSNLYVRTGGEERLVVLDFGSALLRGEPTSSGMTSTGRLWGTPEYMSPEQWTGAEDLDGRTDIYSLGIVLWQAIAGRHPFTASTQYAWQQAHLTAAIPSLRDAAPGTPPALAALIERMMAKRRDDRPADMAAVEAELAAILERPTPKPPAPEPKPKGPRLWIVLLACALLVGSGIAIGLKLRKGAHHRDRRPSAGDASTAPVLDLALHPLQAGAGSSLALPSDVDRHGSAHLEAYRFADRNGVGFLVFAYSDPAQTMWADLYAGTDQSVHLLRELTEPVADCDPSSVILNVVDQTLGIADADGDGIAEVTYGYHAGCGGRDPVDAKLVVLEGSDKYILRGELTGAVGTPDPAEASWPPSFLAHARSLWAAVAAP